VTRLNLTPYSAGQGPAPGSVPVTVLVLAKNEAKNLPRCLGSVAWARQVIVVDSGSDDATVAITKGCGAQVVEEPWRGFSRQRQFALTMPEVSHDWIFFVDADEWVSADLAEEVATAVETTEIVAFRLRFRLVFEGRWIRHCGWYGGAWLTRLMRRDAASFDLDNWVDRPRIEGRIGELRNDIVDEDLKGLAAWLHKHVGYAELEAERRRTRPPLRHVLRDWRSLRQTDTRPLSRAVLKDLVFPWVPAKPLGMFFYMYVVRLGFLDGLTGLRFCFFHAWFQATVNALEDSRQRQPPAQPDQL
jgi:glycosyltransferase involved in cell wall biosynthesis